MAIATDLAGHPLVGDYAVKQASYFGGARHDFVALLPDNPRARLLEVGCATGLTAALARAKGKAGHITGVELMPAVAAKARAHVDRLIIGNIEDTSLPLVGATEADSAEDAGGQKAAAHDPLFDACILSEVIEHLVDPWAVVRRLADHLRPGGIVLASSPNVAQWRIMLALWRGRFDLTDQGLMDRTHMRWFTCETYPELFTACGLQVERSWPLVPLSAKQRLLATLAGGRQHLFVRQVCVMARKPA
ncbi:MAG: class I SAM-dependent methyltransferase [Pseudomonadota bacterium]